MIYKETIATKMTTALMELMRPMGLMRLIGPMGLMGLIVLVGLTSCSSDSDEEEVVMPTEVPIEVMSYVTWFDENVAKTRAEGAYEATTPLAPTRAWIPPTGFSQFAEEQKIGICFTKNDQKPMIGHFFKSSGKWRTNVEIPEAATYYLYGYTPHDTGISCEISSSATPGDNSSYSNGSVLTIKNLPAITPNDVCVVIGAKNGKNDYKADADYSVTDLRRGDFAYAAQKVTTTEASEGNYVYMLFDHLYAALRLCMRVDAAYDAIRTIKLKEITLSTKAGDTPTNKKTDITVKLNKTDGGDPIESIVYTQTGDEEAASSVFSTDEGLVLTTDYSEYHSHFMPLGVTTLIITSTFDIYDKNVTTAHPEGNLIRENAKATNTLVLNKLFSGQNTARRGCQYSINLTIQPTYLYQMSDPDLVNPSMVVE